MRTNSLDQGSMKRVASRLRSEQNSFHGTSLSLKYVVDFLVEAFDGLTVVCENLPMDTTSQAEFWTIEEFFEMAKVVGCNNLVDSALLVDLPWYDRFVVAILCTCNIHHVLPIVFKRYEQEIVEVRCSIRLSIPLDEGDSTFVILGLDFDFLELGIAVCFG